MDRYQFLVRGESGQYEVIFRKIDGQIIATCTCQAGEHGLHCKHRVAIAEGDGSNILSDNQTELQLVGELIRDTDLEKALLRFIEAERDYNRAHKQLAAAKKALRRAMNGEIIG
jgi:hypothetical protein